MSDFQNPFVRGMLGGQAAANQNTAQQINTLGGLLSMQQNAEMRPLQLEKIRGDLAAQQQSRQALQTYGQSIADPNERMKFMADPQGYMKEQNKRYVVGHNLVGGNGNISYAGKPDAKLVEVPVPGQPGVTQPTWMVPGEAAGTAIGGQKMPDILNPQVQGARIAIAQAGKPVTNVNVSTEKKYGEQFASQIAKADSDMRDAANKAPDLADRSNRVIKLLQESPITGTGANFRLQFAKAAKLAGLSNSDTAEVTETLAAGLAQNTLDAIKASGLGSGNGFSNADRDFLEKAAGGLIGMEAGSIKRLAELSHRAAEKSAERWNTRVKEIPSDALSGTGIKTDPISVPQLYRGRRATDAVTNGEWKIEPVGGQ